MTLKVAAVALSLLGLLGTVLPGLPGTILIFFTALGYGWVTDFAEVRSPTLWLLGGLAALAQVGDFAVGAVTTRIAGASRRAMVGAVAGALLGILVFGPVGLIAGPFIGAFMAELTGRRDLRGAGRAGIAAGAGAVLALVVKVVIGLTMVVLFWTAMF